MTRPLLFPIDEYDLPDLLKDNVLLVVDVVKIVSAQPNLAELMHSASSMKLCVSVG